MKNALVSTSRPFLDVKFFFAFLASTTLRTVLGTKIMSEILSDRETIAEAILTSLDVATDPWGVKVISSK